LPGESSQPAEAKDTKNAKANRHANRLRKRDNLTPLIDLPMRIGQSYTSTDNLPLKRMTYRRMFAGVRGQRYPSDSDVASFREASA
jgi:hypothetical protein